MPFLTGATCMLKFAKELISKMWFPLRMGVLGASIATPLPFALLALKKWITDIGKYGVMFPYVWAAFFIVLVLSNLTDSCASIVPDERSSGWYIYVVILGVTMCFSLITYAGAFLILEILHTVSHRFRRFFLLWVLTFFVITVSVYVTETMEEEELWNFFNEFEWSQWSWKSDSSESENDMCLKSPRNDDDDFVDMRKCKTPAMY